MFHTVLQERNDKHESLQYLLQKIWLSATHCIVKIALQSEDRLEICNLS